MENEDLTKAIIGAAIEVHRALGPGLLESSYEACLCREFDISGIGFQRQLELPVIYKGLKLDVGYRVDLLVQRLVVVEIKAVEQVLPLHEAQLLTYLRLGRCTTGLLINFQRSGAPPGHRTPGAYGSLRVLRPPRSIQALPF